MAIPVLPVWSIRPNWREGILERLSWLTDIMDSTNGTEQRRGLRLSPRRSFEMTFNPIDDARSYFDLFLHRLGTEEILLPLFHDKALLTAGVAIGATALAFDNTYREFETGGFAILLGDGPFNFEIVEITAQDGTGLTVDPIMKAWPKNTVVHPVRIAALSEESQISALTECVGQGSVLFNVVRANDFDEGAWTGILYNGRPILTKEPNRRETLDLNYLRYRVTVDNETGLPYLADEANRAFTVQTHQFLIVGRQEHADFRSFLYRLRGSSQAIWLPSYNRDFRLAQPADAADLTLDIKEIGYAYTGGAITGRQHIFFPKDGVAAKIIDTNPPMALGEERLELEAAVGADLPAGRYGSFLEAVRLSQDEIEIQHHTDTDGASECGVAWRSYQDERIDDEAVAVPPPGGTMAGKHRYWRVKIDSNHGGDGVGFAEIEFRAIKNGPDQASGGTVIFSDEDDAAAFAFDNDLDTAWFLAVAPTDFPVWIGYDFGVDGLGADIRVPVIQAMLNIKNIDIGRAPKLGTIDYSDDGIAWTPFYAFNLNAWTADSYRLVPEPPAQNKHRCWRLIFPTNQGGDEWTTIAEIEFRSEAGGADMTDDPIGIAGRAIGGPGAVAAATAIKAFQENIDYVECQGTANQWVGWVFPEPIEIMEATYTGGWNVENYPASAKLQWSDDEIAWVDASDVVMADYTDAVQIVQAEI